MLINKRDAKIYTITVIDRARGFIDRFYSPLIVLLINKPIGLYKNSVEKWGVMDFRIHGRAELTSVIACK